MALISGDEVFKLEERILNEEALDPILSMYFLLRKYNTTCDTQEEGEVHSDSEFQIAADFLNQLFRFRRQLSQKCNLDNFASHYDRLFAWARDAEQGFELADAEHRIVEAWNLAEKVSVAELLDEGVDEDGFVFVPGCKRWQFLEDKNKRPGIVLRVGCCGLPEDNPQLDLPLFREIGGFDRIDEAPVLSALYELAGRMLTSEHPQSCDSPSNGPNATSAAPLKIRLSDAQNRIVDVVKAKGHRLTTPQIHSALEKLYGPTSLGMAKQDLAALVRIGELDNKRDATPPGYGLPE